MTGSMTRLTTRLTVLANSPVDTFDTRPAGDETGRGGQHRSGTSPGTCSTFPTDVQNFEPWC